MAHKTLLWVFVAVLLIPQAFAALQVTAFSCNGETGTANIPINDAFTCSATINNPDDTTATLNTVKLYIDGIWATQAYDGIGFSTSLTTGASTAVSFFDITPTTPGSHKFSYILLDSVSDTFVADTTVNVMDIRISDLRANLSSAGQNDQFSVIAEIPINGAMSVSATIELSDCTLATGEESTKTLGSLTEGSQTSISWRLVMGSGECSYTVTVTGTGSGKVNDDLSGTISNTATGGGDTGGGSGGSGGGGGGGGGGSALTSESAIVPQIAAGGIGGFVFKKFESLGVYDISFRANVNLENAKLIVKETRLAKDVALPVAKEEGLLYKYLSISKEKVTTSEMSDVKIKFKIPNTWFINNSIIPSSIEMKKLIRNNWVSMPTVSLGADSKFRSYESTMQNLSIFAITGIRQEGIDMPTEEIITETPSDEREEIGDVLPTDDGQEATQKTTSLSEYFNDINAKQKSGLAVIGGLGIIIAFILWLRHHRKMIKIEKNLNLKS